MLRSYYENFDNFSLVLNNRFGFKTDEQSGKDRKNVQEIPNRQKTVGRHPFVRIQLLHFSKQKIHLSVPQRKDFSKVKH